MRRLLLILNYSFFIFNFSLGQSLTSPDGRLKVDIQCSGSQLSYSIREEREPEDRIFALNNHIALHIEGMGNSKYTMGKVKSVSEHIVAPNYRQGEFDIKYNQLIIKNKNGVNVEFRAFDSGIAYRFVSQKGTWRVKDEVAEFNFKGDPVAYLAHSTNPKKPEAMAFQATYDAQPLSQQPDLLAFLPATIVCNGAKVTLMESDVEHYPGMFVAPYPWDRDAEGKSPLMGGLRGAFSHYPKTFDYYAWRKQKYVTSTEDYIAQDVSHTPWRIIAIAHTEKEMPTNNMVYALASPSRIDDTSWIKPGHVAWDWWNDWGISGVPFKAGINNETYKHYIDFATKYGLEYVILDEGWYEPKSGNMLATIPDIDLPMLVQYARERNVRLILWTVFNVLDDQLQEACRKYADMGIAGFKVDFLDRNDQEALEMTYRIAEACAQHHLVLDYHGIYAPQGIQRTWPNVLNFEAVFGMEEVKWTKHDEKDMPAYDVTFPFIRGQAGYVDFTPGGMRNATRADFQPIYNNPLTMGTRCHQLAHYIVHESPLTMLADNPTVYEQERECTQFIASLPTRYTSMQVLDGVMGEYIVVLRTDVDGHYYLGGETNWNERTLDIPLSFLPEGKNFKADIFVDGPNANHVATDYQHQQQVVGKGDTLHLTLASGGGFAIRLI